MAKPQPLSPQEIHTKLREEFGDEAIVAFVDPLANPDPDPKKKRAGDSWIEVKCENITKVAAFLREADDLFMDSLMCLGAMDETAEMCGGNPCFSVSYHLHSFRHRHRIFLKVRVSRENPKIKSVQGIWSGANWFEREAYDLLGIHFENHPDLRRLLLPPDWVGFPLRKDYEFPLEYNGISCSRPKLK